MDSMSTKASEVTWRNVLANPFVFGVIVLPLDSNDTLALISVCFLLVGTGSIPLQIQRLPRSTSIACGVMFALGCGIGGFALTNVLEYLFPNFPTVKQWEWMQWLPSVFGNLAILVWVFIVLNIAPITRPLLISIVLIAASAGYMLSLDVLRIRSALIFDVIREITDWEEGIAALLNGCALFIWERFITRELAKTQLEQFVRKCTLLLGVMSILFGILGILWSIFF